MTSAVDIFSLCARFRFPKFTHAHCTVSQQANGRTAVLASTAASQWCDNAWIILELRWSVDGFEKANVRQSCTTWHMVMVKVFAHSLTHTHTHRHDPFPSPSSIIIHPGNMGQLFKTYRRFMIWILPRNACQPYFFYTLGQRMKPFQIQQHEGGASALKTAQN